MKGLLHFTKEVFKEPFLVGMVGDEIIIYGAHDGINIAFEMVIKQHGEGFKVSTTQFNGRTLEVFCSDYTKVQKRIKATYQDLHHVAAVWKPVIHAYDI